MDFDQTQAIYDYDDEEEQVKDDKANSKNKEVAHLKVFSQQGFKETVFPVFQGDNIIGRDGKCNITIPIKALSKKHACIEVQRDLHLIYDCESKNRTKKGKSFLKPTIRYEIKHGDMLTLGDVRCQYLVGLDMEEEDEDETGSETGSESMLQDVNTEQEVDNDKPILTADASTSMTIIEKDGKNGVNKDESVQPTEDDQVSKQTKDDEEAYAADTDSDTDEESPLAVAAIPTVLYSSEDENETPRRQQATSVEPSKGNSSMEGQTLAFGLGSPADVFQSRDSTGSSGSHPGQTASIPPTLVLSAESDSHSDGKLDESSDQDNKPTPFKHPGARGPGTQPPCEPTLVYGSESDDASPIKRPVKRPKARVSDKGPTCDPTLVYGSESDDGSPIKRPKHPGARASDMDPSCEPTLQYGSESDDGIPKTKLRQPSASDEPTLLYESDSEEGTTVAPNTSKGGDQTLLYTVVRGGKPVIVPAVSPWEAGGGSPEELAEEQPDDKQEAAVAVKDSDTTLPYGDAEMSSTDDEDESAADANNQKTNLDETLEGTLPYADDLRKEDLTDDEHDGVDDDDYGADIATQAYAPDNVDSDSDAGSEPIPLGSGHTVTESDVNQPAKPSDLEATQAYCVEEEEDSDSSDSQPLPIGTEVTGIQVDISATVAYGLEATQAYDFSEKDGNDNDDKVKDDQHKKPTLAFDLQATQAYGADDGDDDDEDIRESRQETAQEPMAEQPTLAYRMEATQAYGADDYYEDTRESHQETIQEPTAKQPTLAYGMEATQAYGAADDDDEDTRESHQETAQKPTAKQPTLAYGMEATQAYGTNDDDDEDTRESHQETAQGPSAKQPTFAYGMEATQAYGADDDDDDDEDTRESHQGTAQEPLADTQALANRSEAAEQPTLAYGMEATQAYGADDETDDEETDNEDRSSTGGDQGNGHDTNAATLAYGLDPTQAYGGDDDDDDENDDDADNRENKDDKDSGRTKQDFLATLPYGMEETQAYDGENNDTDSAQNSMIEATQAYGIEEPSEAELQAQAVSSNYKSERTTKTNKKRVAFVRISEVAEVDETEVGAAVVNKGDKNKPSTSTAADVQDILPDSEELIPPSRSRSKRGRKKPVIEESKEETSQQLREAAIQSESVAASSSNVRDTTEQVDEASEMPEEKSKKQPAKPSTRKGRRGAMRVTVEPEVPEEEEARETSTRRGRRGETVTTDKVEDQEDSATKETSASTAGRRRGFRQTAKATAAGVEDEEAPVTKSRRGRRGKAAQAETSSVSETPLKTSTDPEAAQEETDSPAVAAEAEPPNVRRGGRARGRKGVTAKETVQTAENQGEEIAGTPVQSQPESESHVEPVSTKGKGKGRGKGRGKKSQPSEPMESESLDVEVPSISDEVQPEEVPATPARGKGRGRGRGKKALPKPSTGQDEGASTSSSPHLIPETPFINDDDELPAPESPVLAAASTRGKGRGRQGRGKRVQPSVTELEASEETSQPESNAGSRESSQTRKRRGKGKVLMESTEQNSDAAVNLSESTELSETIRDSEESSTAGSSKGSRRGRQRKEAAVEDSEQMEVEETPAKKSRRGKEPAVNRSPSLNRGKSPAGSCPKVMFTGLVDKEGEKVVTSLGGQLVENIHQCSHLVTDKVRRTVKFLCGLAGGQIIVLPSWLDACKKAKSFVDASPYLVKDRDAEKQYKFNLQRSHEIALTKSLLEGYKIHVTKKVKPEPSQMKDIIQSAKGEFLSSMPRSNDRVFVISCEEDKSVCKKPLDAGIPVVSAEVLLTGVLRQELNLDEYKLFADVMSDTSQDTSGQSKRRRGASEASASSSVTETKTTGSTKRRKR